MERKAVQSFMIAAVGYDPESRILEVEFRNGAVYQYHDVPEEVYTGLINAESHGSYLNSRIKTGGYRYQKVA